MTDPSPLPSREGRGAAKGTVIPYLEGGPVWEASAAERPRARRRLLPHSGPAARTAGVLALVWLALVAVTSAAAHSFISWQTVVAVAFSMSVVGVLSVGVSVVVVSGGLVDLSIPAATSFAALTTASVLHGAGSLPAVLAGMAAGVGVGLLNGLIIVGLRVNPIVTTLGINFLGQGALSLVFGRRDVPTTSWLYRFELNRLLDLPVTWWLMVVLLCVTAVAISQTRFGRHAVAAGGSPVAARRQGIRLPRVRLATFGFMGVCTGLAGVLYAGGSQLLAPGDTTGLMFPAITAVILSGFSLRGGQGFLPVVFVGTALLSTVPTALVSLGLSPNWEQFVQGALLASAVAFDGLRQRRRRS